MQKKLAGFPWRILIELTQCQGCIQTGNNKAVCESFGLPLGRFGVKIVALLISFPRLIRQPGHVEVYP